MYKIQDRFLVYTFLGLLVILSIAGCSAPTSDMPELPSVITSPPTRLAMPTPTLSPKLNITLEPTLSVASLLSYIISVSQNNGGCNLPCVWGFDPRVNTANDLDVFMRRFGDVDMLGEYYIHSDLSEDHAALDLGVWENNLETDISFSRVGGKEINYLFLTVAVPKTKQPNFWTINQTSPFHVYYSNYLLPAILLKYGKPSSIYVGPEPEDDVPARQTELAPIKWTARKDKVHLIRRQIDERAERTKEVHTRIQSGGCAAV
jgi:hypothetical protein